MSLAHLLSSLKFTPSHLEISFKDSGSFREFADLRFVLLSSEGDGADQVVADVDHAPLAVADAGVLDGAIGRDLGLLLVDGEGLDELGEGIVDGF